MLIMTKKLLMRRQLLPLLLMQRRQLVINKILQMIKLQPMIKLLLMKRRMTPQFKNNQSKMQLMIHKKHLTKLLK